MKDKLIFDNTYKRGHTTFIIFKQVRSYIGVCLEFDLIVKCNSMKEAYEHLTDYAQAWLKNVVKNKLPEQLLNRPADEKFWKLAKQVDANRRFEAFINRNKKNMKPYAPDIASFYLPYIQNQRLFA